MIGENAAPDNAVESGQVCFNITLEMDDIKEGAESFTLNLQSDDECVWLGRDVALALTPANGGKSK